MVSTGLNNLSDKSRLLHPYVIILAINLPGLEMKSISYLPKLNNPKELPVFRQTFLEQPPANIED